VSAVNSLYINGAILTFEEFVERRTGLNMRVKSPDELTELIRVVISWDCKYRALRRTKPRRELSVIYKYAYIKHLFENEGFTYREIAQHLNELGLRSPTNKLWTREMMKAFCHRCKGVDIPEGFDPIEWEKNIEVIRKEREEERKDNLIAKIKSSYSVDKDS
tara:strand:+ start:1817 stop:2302 length:486 start_codon:yes stop_codon:yes gene_type:complete